MFLKNLYKHSSKNTILISLFCSTNFINKKNIFNDETKELNLNQFWRDLKGKEHLWYGNADNYWS